MKSAFSFFKVIAIFFFTTGCTKEPNDVKHQKDVDWSSPEKWEKVFTEGMNLSPYQTIAIIEEYHVRTGPLQGGIRFEIYRKARVIETLRGQLPIGTELYFHHAFETDSGVVPEPKSGKKAFIFLDDHYDIDNLFYLQTGDYLGYEKFRENGLKRALAKSATLQPNHSSLAN